MQTKRKKKEKKKTVLMLHFLIHTVPPTIAPLLFTYSGSPLFCFLPPILNFTPCNNKLIELLSNTFMEF